MYIVNEFNVTHSIPDDWAIPAGARRATADEAAAYDSGGDGGAAPVASAGPSLEVLNALAERDAEIARLQAALAAAQQPAPTGKGKINA